MAYPDSEALVKFRKRMYLKQQEMADKLGVPIARYKNWEYGHEPPGAKKYNAVEVIVAVNVLLKVTVVPVICVT